MANAALEFSLNAPIVVIPDASNVARTLLPETKRLVSTLELPSEKYNVKGLRVNSYITVGRRSYPKDRRDTILTSTYPENPSSSSPTYACTSERNVAEEYRRAVEAKSNRRQERRCSVCLHFFSYALFAGVATDAASMHNNPDMYGDACSRKLIESSSSFPLAVPALAAGKSNPKARQTMRSPSEAPAATRPVCEQCVNEERFPEDSNRVTQSPHECNSIGARQGSYDRSTSSCIDRMDVSGEQDVGIASVELGSKHWQGQWKRYAHGEFSVERRVRWGIQAKASMKQKVERDTMNDRASTCTSGVCVCIYIYTCNTYMYLAGTHSSRTEPVSLEVARARRFISCAAKRIKRYICIWHCIVY
ncbi:hypothetical protein ALC56_05198 [Trachymyrmex septentrionalis]|uniref:Uncharacterized protein n=1 Tax=Trachymyrmex septentrionalis TaxID=34720 RepID=A0A195FIM6_9HYME|nr:hypothetical protein ALC56_05198 [Trachymyrmex septentrionalis]